MPKQTKFKKKKKKKIVYWLNKKTDLNAQLNLILFLAPDSVLGTVFSSENSLFIQLL